MAITKKRGLSRGLNALLANSSYLNKNLSKKTEKVEQEIEQKAIITTLKIELLKPGQFQPRQEFVAEDLVELAESIKNQGILQPLVVRKLEKNYEIIAVEIRRRDAKIAGLQDVPVVIKEAADKTALVMALIENIQRENLNPLEEAQALDRLAKEFDLTHAEVAQAVGKSRATVSNLLRVLTLKKEVKELLEKKQLELGHAKILVAIPGNLQLQIANKIISEQLSVRAAEEFINKFLNQDTKKALINTQHNKSLDPDVQKLIRKISEKLAATVKIITLARGKGKLVIEYNSLDELQGILENMELCE
jgi:ParB family chromosome partitioning protein